MVLALDYTPQSATDGYPVPGTLVTLDATGATGTSREFELMSAPDESLLALERLTDAAGDPIDTFTPDQPGEYVFTVYDYRDTGFAPARWTGDITAQRGKKLIGSATGTVYVGEEMDLPIVTTRGEGATLRLTIVNDTVRVATLVNPLTELSRLVCLDASLTTPLANMVDVTAANLGNDLVTSVGDLCTKFEAHRQMTSGSPAVHLTTDSVNAMSRVYVSTTSSVAYAISQLNELRTRITGHAEPGSSATRWHTNDDSANQSIVGPASDIASATVLLADIGYRVYERHRTRVGTPTVHGSADNTNALTAASVLTTFIVAFLNAVAVIDPTVAGGESEGAGDAAHRYGFVRAS